MAEQKPILPSTNETGGDIATDLGFDLIKGTAEAVIRHIVDEGVAESPYQNEPHSAGDDFNVSPELWMQDIKERIQRKEKGKRTLGDRFHDALVFLGRIKSDEEQLENLERKRD